MKDLTFSWYESDVADAEKQKSEFAKPNYLAGKARQYNPQISHFLRKNSSLAHSLTHSLSPTQQRAHKLPLLQS